MNLKSQIVQDQNQEQKTNNALVKLIVLGAISLAPAYFFGYALSNLFAATSLGMLILAFAAGVIFLALFVIHNLLIQQFWLFAAIAAGEALVMLAGFYQKLSLWNGGGALGLFVFLLLGYYFGSQEANNVFKIRLSQLGPVIAGRALTALAILTAVAYLGTVNFFQPDTVRQFILGIVKPIQPLVTEIVGNIVPGAGSLVQTNKFFSAEAMADLIYQSTASKIFLLPKIYQDLIVAAVGLLIFLTIKGFSPLIRVLVIPVALAFYQFLRAFGFFHIELESRSKEVIKV
ncbi:MAG: hypothetical protein A3I24_04210 [Candidatus Harrisonbacteria bacterium RIFCSPLOWO2_02_FULL_41_13b]|uniref:Uncharacterized protein n=1 Tax=Candidatus Harrisonbacteria bacterium RIFCSPLOWO2_02_FULL_41_13b TaxID=1798409 RepID=A0A1G1ZQ90_9BACT|nr:MAG: hypothetical protein A3I24_04210 [Candidatus Harrisonbacteria bacterium RIFCSPLOWO2_02_FULL_41_13b]